MSALVRIKDSCRTAREVRKVPLAASCTATNRLSIRSLIRACEQRDGHFDAERLRGLEFDHELDAPWQLAFWKLEWQLPWGSH
jgi:hypothetical protein